MVYPIRVQVQATRVVPFYRSAAVSILKASSGLHEMLWWGEVDLRPQGSAVVSCNGNASGDTGFKIGRC